MLQLIAEGLGLPEGAVVLAPSGAADAYERACYDLLAAMGGRVVVDQKGREVEVVEPMQVRPEEAERLERTVWLHAFSGDLSAVRQLTGRPIGEREAQRFREFVERVVTGEVRATAGWWKAVERRALSARPEAVLYASLLRAYEARGLGRREVTRRKVALASRCMVCGTSFERRGAARTCGRPECRREAARRRFRRWYALHKGRRAR
ncbi:MAG: hypothetical protein QN193_01805 [Armatimonadota bacterium]|nr:hypothetical protein [Armatimonadota bacterium]MDR7443484.1 hypothetical protein [Armatimonadota bacterium]MDR7569323.1 hypothetical protein [Armatimonadota bacterium]